MFDCLLLSQMVYFLSTSLITLEIFMKLQMLGGVELVPLLARRRAAAERHPLSSTDVTKTRNVNG